MYIPIPIGNSYSRELSGTAMRIVKCENCKAEYVYRLVRTATGSALNILWLDGEGADLRATERATDKLERKLASDVNPVPCPTYGHFQQDMVWEARRRYLSWMRVGNVAMLLLCYFMFFCPLALLINSQPKDGFFIPIQQFFYGLGVGGLILLSLPFIRIPLSRRYHPNKENLVRRIKRGYFGGVLLSEVEKKAGGRQIDTSKEKPAPDGIQPATSAALNAASPQSPGITPAPPPPEAPPR